MEKRQDSGAEYMDLTAEGSALLREELKLAQSRVKELAKERDELAKELAKERSKYNSVRVTSPLTQHLNVEYTQWTPDEQRKDGTRWWKSWCACCKKPLDITAFGVRESEQVDTSGDIAAGFQGRAQGFDCRDQPSSFGNAGISVTLT